MKWFLNLKTQTKLLSGFSLVAVMLTIVGVMGISGLGKINTRLDDLYERHFMASPPSLAAEADMQRRKSAAPGDARGRCRRDPQAGQAVVEG
ncbi:MAG: MCP four helix bundle domain-containing protein [Candidatus Eisenbacteria bacterium]|nr:MCP four helix bundle domain-containing protein [Candidatus Eisenbacteria bacterium]